MLGLGLALGFIGFGGAGFITALLILVFHVPVHLAFGTALGAMFATAATGGWSHLREGNVDLVAAVQIGLAGIVGAYLGGSLALATGASHLKTISGLVLMVNSGIMYLRTRMVGVLDRSGSPTPPLREWHRQLPEHLAIGLLCGLGSGLLGIGVAPWIQVGLLMLKGTDLRTTIGTTMLALALMSLSGAVRFAQGGQVSAGLLASVLLGLVVGSFVGAKFTKRAPRWLVRTGLIATPFLAGALLILAPISEG